MIGRLNNRSGFTLIELVMVIVIVAVMAAVAVRYTANNIETAKYEQTLKEMEQLGDAIIGNQAAYSEGTPTDFGYVGDIGALPPYLDYLVENIDEYDTWDGPYINLGYNDDDFKKDAWGVDYTYNVTTITSAGSGADIDYTFAANTTELFNNTVDGFVVDANKNPPGQSFMDSLTISLTYPNGTGGMTAVSLNPNEDGSFTFDDVPVGAHTLTIIYTYSPVSDTVTFKIAVNPRKTERLSIVYPADLW